MRHRVLLLLSLSTLALAACGGSGTPPPTQSAFYAAPTAAPNTPPPAPTSTAAATPAATPDIEKILNPQPGDWTRGPKDAKVTLIEWGDFQ